MQKLLLIAAVALAALAFVAPAGAANVAAAQVETACGAVPTPPATLDTVSKYDQTDATRSSLLTSAAVSRESILQPIREAVDALYSSVQASGDYRCAVSTLTVWADAGALSNMQSEDAFLSRDRLISETVLLLVEAARNGGLEGAGLTKISTWLRNIADSTIEFYTFRAGIDAKRNNHRYWAGLAVGAIGYLLKETAFIDWATQSYMLGVCQVDGDGFLPLELARGSQALNYHVYALRPLLTFAALAAANGNDIHGACDAGLNRLLEATKAALADPVAFGKIVGAKQNGLVRENGYPEIFRMAARLPAN